MKFKEGMWIRHIGTSNTVIKIFTSDSITSMYIVGNESFLIAVKKDSLEEWYEELLPVEQELW